MSSKSKVVPECCVLTFYGIDARCEAAERFYDTIVDVFNDMNSPPDKVSIHRARAGKPISFGLGNARLQNRGFKGVTGFELVSPTPNGLTPNDYVLAAGWSAKYSYALLAARCSLATLSDESLRP